MPYANKEDKNENYRIKRRVKQLKFFESMGLEQLTDDTLSCQYCLRDSSIHSPHKYRHWPDCPILPRVAELLNLPIEKLIPKQKAPKPPGLTEAQLKQRRDNVKKIAEYRKGKPQNEW